MLYPLRLYLSFKFTDVAQVLLVSIAFAISIFKLLCGSWDTVLVAWLDFSLVFVRDRCELDHSVSEVA